MLLRTNQYHVLLLMDRFFSVRCAEIGLHWLQADCEHLFSDPKSMTPSWWIAIRHDGHNYTMEIGKCYKIVFSYDRGPLNILFFFLSFLGPDPWNMEVPRLGI